MAAVALTLFILWICSLWLLLIERHRPVGLLLLQPLVLMSGLLLFSILSLASLLLLWLLLAD
jgi:hypothetical protein